MSLGDPVYVDDPMSKVVCELITRHARENRGNALLQRIHDKAVALKTEVFALRALCNETFYEDETKEMLEAISDLVLHTGKRLDKIAAKNSPVGETDVEEREVVNG